MKLRIPKSVAFFFAPLMILLGSLAAYAQEGAQFIPIPVLQFGLGVAESPRDVATTLQILALLTVLSVAPGIILMMTCFTRILIVLGFVQRAIGLQQTPPSQVIVSLALFLTLFIMAPTWNKIYDNALNSRHGN